MAATDARPIPLKNTAFRVTFPILDNTGAPVTGAAGLDSEVSLDGAAFSDCTNEATEIGSSGIYYLDLTSGEMNGDTIAVQVKTSTTDAKTTVLIFYPQELGDIKVDVQSNAGTAITSASGIQEVKVASIAADAVSAAAIANGAIDAATFAADVDAEILSYIVDDATRIDASALNTAAVTSVPAILADTNELQTDWVNGGRLDLILDARASQASVDDLPTNAELATALDPIPTATENADALLNRDMSAVSDTEARSPLNALRFLRNKWAVAAGTLTVRKEDDATPAWTAAVSSDASAEPIIGSDPA
jgi:hypothetical protein